MNIARSSRPGFCISATHAILALGGRGDTISNTLLGPDRCADLREAFNGSRLSDDLL